jgi:hypothetical protein
MVWQQHSMRGCLEFMRVRNSVWRVFCFSLAIVTIHLSRYVSTFFRHALHNSTHAHWSDMLPLIRTMQSCSSSSRFDGHRRIDYSLISTNSLLASYLIPPLSCFCIKLTMMTLSLFDGSSLPLALARCYHIIAL